MKDEAESQAVFAVLYVCAQCKGPRNVTGLDCNCKLGFIPSGENSGILPIILPRKVVLCLFCFLLQLSLLPEIQSLYTSGR